METVSVLIFLKDETQTTAARGGRGEFKARVGVLRLLLTKWMAKGVIYGDIIGNEGKKI